MPTIPAADQEQMLETDLADTAIIEGVSVKGLFDKEYIDVLDVAGTVPVFTCTKSRLDAITPTVARGTTVTINSVAYTIENIKPDNTGLTTLVLSD